jgi:hypothetical protein
VLLNLFGLVGRVGGAAFTAKRRRVEASLGRLEYLGQAAKAAFEVALLVKANEAKRKAVAKITPQQQATDGRGTKRKRATQRARVDDMGDGDDSDRTVSDQSGSGDDMEDERDSGKDAGGAAVSTTLAWWVRARFPFEARSSDAAVLGKYMNGRCRYWAGVDGGILYSFPSDNLFWDALLDMKIKDSCHLCGMVGVYILGQCTGLSPRVLGRLAAYLHALENLTLKAVRREEVASRQAELTEAIAGLYPVLPCYVVGTIVNEQIQHWDKQVNCYSYELLLTRISQLSPTNPPVQTLEGGPPHASGTLDTENMMPFFRSLCSGKKRQEASMAGLYAGSEQAYYWGLDGRDLRTPANQRAEYTRELPRGRPLTGDPEKSPLASILGLLVDEPNSTCPDIVRAYTIERRAHVAVRTQPTGGRRAPR